jgi:hypothetical protein
MIGDAFGWNNTKNDNNMKFTTDFKVSGVELKYTPNPVIEHRQSCAEDELGRNISGAFGFKELGIIEESGLAGLYKLLEIEAFPMEKWIEFKQKLFTELSNSIDPSRHIINEVKVLKLIKELESFGEPAGAAKEL